MAQDPAFLFYPGDYLRDTQCLSEKAQVAYDRIMCEHMRNICITQQQLNFFIKRLNEDEKDEIKMILTKIPGGFQISWVAESITQRRLYSESRRKNKQGKTKNISKSYDSHMEIEIENVIEDKKENKNLNEISDFEIGKSIEYVKTTGQKSFTPDQVKEYWAAFLIQTENEFYNNRDKKIQHFRNWLKKQDNGTKQTSTNSSEQSERGTSGKRVDAVRKW